MSQFEVYKLLAYHYDDLMPNEEYDLWLQVLSRYLALVKQEREPVIVDLGCGTGTLAVKVAEQISARVYGVDISEDMLAVADQKARLKQVQLQLLEQDMTQLSLPEQAAVIYCFCDSLNYLLDEQAVINTFKQVYLQLQKGGLFLFDVHSLYKFEHVFQQNAFSYNSPELCYIWDCDYNSETQVVQHDLSFFIRQEDSTYLRFDETHLQRYYSLKNLTAWLEASGFEIVKIFGDFTPEEPHDHTERVFYVARCV